MNWEALISDWVEQGLSYQEFWTLTLRECDLIIRARLAGRKSEIAAQRVLQQEMAQLVSFAFHKPDKMPDFTKDKSAKRREVAMGEQEADARLRAFFVTQAAQST